MLSDGKNLCRQYGVVQGEGYSGWDFLDLICILCQARKVTEMGLCEVVAWVPSTFHHFLLLLFINNGRFKFVLSRGKGAQNE